MNEFGVPKSLITFGELPILSIDCLSEKGQNSAFVLKLIHRDGASPLPAPRLRRAGSNDENDSQFRYLRYALCSMRYAIF